MRNAHKTATSGFTLVELLVVIGIISVLVAVLMVSFDAAREVTKNKAVRAAVKETQLAIELYRSQNGRYPDTLAALVPEYIAEVPDAEDAANENCAYTYDTDAGGTYFKYTGANCLAGASSAAEGIKPDDEMARCPSSCISEGDPAKTCHSGNYNSYIDTADFYESVAVYSLGGACE